jgi:glycosyltransferase involved in cell wall biosynthesis
MASLVTHLANGLSARLPGVQVDVVDTYGPGAFWMMPFTLLVAAFRLVFAKIRRRADLVHVHMASDGSVPRKSLLALIATGLGLPTIIHLHGADFDEFVRSLAPGRRRLLVRVLERCAAVVVIGNHWRDVAVDELGLDPERVVMIHNGVPTWGPAREKTSGRAPLLLMVGELGPRKGTPELIAALGTSELRTRDWRAVLAGDGAVERARSDIASLGLSHRVSTPGWQSQQEVRRLLDTADIFVLPSHHEGLPMAILEAMASGTAVLATPVGAIPDAIVDGETGLLVQPGDVAGLTRALVRLLDDPELRERLAVGGRRRFEQSFTIDRTVDAVARLYQKLEVI